MRTSSVTALRNTERGRRVSLPRGTQNEDLECHYPEEHRTRTSSVTALRNTERGPRASLPRGTQNEELECHCPEEHRTRTSSVTAPRNTEQGPRVSLPRGTQNEDLECHCPEGINTERKKEPFVQNLISRNPLGAQPWILCRWKAYNKNSNGSINFCSNC
ncbi:UNVERIFIED_CONTAM: hypothetical protein FKN15_042719 [Acipenser sinensis]